MFRIRKVSSALPIFAMMLAGFIPFSGAQAKDRIVYSFAGGNDGANPLAGLTIDTKGNLFGTTYHGGPNNGGTIFEIAQGGTESVLYAFTGGNDGGGPQAKLIMDDKGNLYGTTVFGSTTGPGGQGAGTVFSFRRAFARETIIWTFGGLPDGDTPVDGLLPSLLHFDGTAKAVDFYGTTYSGGAYGYGAVFKVTPKGKETVLYSFTGGNDGAAPGAGLILDAYGNLFGTTEAGGASGFGTVFKITPKGKETVLHAFTRGSDGAYPQADLIADAAGNFYSTTAGGGANFGGTVFKITPGGKETVLYAFGAGTDGTTPEAGMLMDGAGDLYGTTYLGGGTSCNCGTVFKLTSKGVETVLHAFAGGSDGAYPQSIPVMDKKGNLFGTTGQGGESNVGTVFEVKN